MKKLDISLQNSEMIQKQGTDCRSGGTVYWLEAGALERHTWPQFMPLLLISNLVGQVASPSESQLLHL